MAKVTITKNAYVSTNEKTAEEMRTEIDKAQETVRDRQQELARAILDGKPQADISQLMAQVTSDENTVNQLERDLSNPLMVEHSREGFAGLADKMFALAETSPSAYAELGSITITQSIDDDGGPVILVSVRNPNVPNSRAHLEAEIKPDKPEEESKSEKAETKSEKSDSKPEAKKA